MIEIFIKSKHSSKYSQNLAGHFLDNTLTIGLGTAIGLLLAKFV